MTCLSHFPCSGIGLCIHRRNSRLTSLSFAFMRSRRVFRWIMKDPRRDLPQIRVNPKKLKVSGLPSPRCLPLTHCVPEAAGVTLMLKAYDQVVGISHYDHVARGLPPSPAPRPKNEGGGL